MEKKQPCREDKQLGLTAQYAHAQEKNSQKISSPFFPAAHLEGPENSRQPNGCGKIIQGVDCRNGVAAKGVGDAGEQGRLFRQPHTLNKKKEEAESQKKMENHIDIKGQRKGEKKKQKGNRVKNTRLDIAHKGRSAEIMRAPEGDLPGLQGSGEVGLHGIKPAVNIPEKEDLA